MSNDKTATKKGLGRGLNSLLGGSQLNDSQQGEKKPPSKIQNLSPATSTAKKLAELASEEKKTISETAVPAAGATASISNESKIPIEARVWSLPIEKVQPNPRQPRKTFAIEKLKELADSIKAKGVLQPITVRKNNDKYEIIAGERRWRATQIAGLHEIPAIIRTSDDQDSLELALIENIQRDDLNSIDEAKAYQELATQFKLSHSEIAEKVGKDRVTITNSMRLLGLNEDVQKMIIHGTLSAGHAKVLLGLESKQKQLELAKLVATDKLSVRKLESLVIKLRTSNNEKHTPEDIGPNISKTLVSGLTDELQKLLGTKVAIDYENAKGKVSLYFYSDDQLSEIAERLRSAWQK